MRVHNGIKSLPPAEAANVGKRCRWTTYPNAGVGHHEGTIRDFIPAGDSLSAAETRAVGLLSSPLARAAECVAFDRYLVKEERTGAGGKRLAARWYAPRVSVVEVVS